MRSANLFLRYGPRAGSAVLSTEQPEDRAPAQIAQDRVYPTTAATPLEDAGRIVDQFVRCYNTERLQGPIGYVTPEDKLTGQEVALLADRKRKLAKARKQRSLRLQQADPEPTSAHHFVSPDVGVACTG